VSSPLLGLPGAVSGDGIDAPVAAHYGSFNLEQRALAGGEGFVDLSHRDVVRIEGPDRLTWLHSLTTQHLVDLQPGIATTALILDPQGHVEHAFIGVDDGVAFTLHTEPGRATALIDFLSRMKFLMRVDIADITQELAVSWRPSRGAGADAYELVSRSQLTQYAAAAGPAAGVWAFESRAASHGSARTQTRGRFPTRWAGSAPRCTWTRAATAGRRRSHACTRWDDPRAG
jgi:folate-binding Fe-S cluster repair protein YgfZ